jgi:phosphate transport system permease protein
LKGFELSDDFQSSLKPGSALQENLQAQQVSAATASAGVAGSTKRPRSLTKRAGFPSRRWRKAREFVIETLLFLAALTSVLATVGIAGTLIVESIPFFAEVPLTEFLFAAEWTPLFANPRYGILPLFAGTFVTTMVALSVAIPIGSIAAVYLSEYAHPRFREIAKPTLELLSAVPTVVYGYFALLFVTPLLQTFMPNLPGFNMLSAGLVMGVMIIPYVSSLSEDAMRSVPMYLREGAYAMGATKLQTATGVVIPAAFSGITSAYILGISRAVGETMVVAIAAGMQPNLTLNPTEPAATITAYIVQVSLGDLPHDSIGYQTIFAAGLTLLLFTFCFNIVGHFMRKRFRETY